MAVAASVLDAMVKAGCTAEQIVAVVRADEDAQAERLAHKREQNRIRQQNHRSRNAMSRVTERDVALLPSSPEVSPHTPLPNPSNPIPPSPPKGGSSPTPKAALETVLDAEHAQAVIDHRQKIRKPLTPHAALLLATKFAKHHDANAAADAMIANGWQGFEAEWMANRTAVMARHGGRGLPGYPAYVDGRI